MLLRNLQWIKNGSLVNGDIRIHDSLIHETGLSLLPQKKERTLTFDNHFLYPGLINAHDHLEMNLYPNLGNPPYDNYTQWAADIYRPQESPVKEIEAIPLGDRLLWGGIKNLISGVTTVVHHNPFHRDLKSSSFPVRVLQKYAWAHSIAFEKNLVSKFPGDTDTPFVIHAAEGVDDFAHSEIEKLRGLNVLRQNTVLIHAVGLNAQDRDFIQASDASIVWCPSSNLFMFNQTADIEAVKKKIKVALGSDSTMTGKATFFEEMRAAFNTTQVSASEIVEFVTSQPQKIFRLPGLKLEPGQAADLLILPKKREDYSENLVMNSSANVTAVIVSGELRFGDLEIAKDLGLSNGSVRVGSKEKWVAFDIKALMSRISSRTGSEFFQKNPLWNLLES